MARDSARWARRARMAAWAAAVALLLLPAAAMQVTDEVDWDAADFAFAGGLILISGIALELTFRMSGSRAYRAATVLALAATLILVWANAAVGIIGSEDNPANSMYLGVLAIAVVGAAAARFKPLGMARALTVTALAQAAVTSIAILREPGFPAAGPLEFMVLNGFFIALWLASARLFRKAAREVSGVGSAS